MEAVARVDALSSCNVRPTLPNWVSTELSTRSELQSRLGQLQQPRGVAGALVVLLRLLASSSGCSRAAVISWT